MCGQASRFRESSGRFGWGRPAYGSSAVYCTDRRLGPRGQRGLREAGGEEVQAQRGRRRWARWPRRERPRAEMALDDFAEVSSGGCEDTVTKVSLGRPRGGATPRKRLEDEIGVEVEMLGPSCRRESRRSSRRPSPGSVGIVASMRVQKCTENSKSWSSRRDAKEPVDVRGVPAVDLWDHRRQGHKPQTGGRGRSDP